MGGLRGLRTSATLPFVETHAVLIAMNAVYDPSIFNPKAPQCNNFLLHQRNLALELVRVTEAAALAGGRWLGKGDKNAADQVRKTFK